MVDVLAMVLLETVVEAIRMCWLGQLDLGTMALVPKLVPMVHTVGHE